MVAPSKRTSQFGNPPSKKRKVGVTKPAPKATKGKQHAFDRLTIPIPERPEEDDENALSDQDIEFFREHTGAGNFLQNIDRAGLARSKKETKRLHELSKPVRTAPKADDLPSVDSHSEDEGEWSNNSPNPYSSEGETDFDDTDLYDQHTDSDEEQSYERKPRASAPEERNTKLSRLPIKLPDGRIVDTGERTFKKDETESEEEAPRPIQRPERKVEDVATGARFGRPAVAAILSSSSSRQRLQMAKEQIAGICQDILADPENSLGLLRRLHSFSLPSIVSPNSEKPIPNDPLIRRLAMLSQLAVLKDVIPGYRIRSLSEAEKAEKVSQMVAKTREWEQGLVSVYQSYLRSLEKEIKGKSLDSRKTEFAELALRSMCTLLKEATHFNFRTNLISTTVMRLSKRSWNNMSDLCLETLISVFKEDITGVPSLEIVRLLNRMIKERKFAVHPNALGCLSYLRLRSELGGIRASETKAENDEKPKAESRSKLDRKRAKGKKVEAPHLSKKARKVLKERKEIEGEMQEATAEVDREEKANMQTETLKLLFVLYFRILKAPDWTPLLPAALEGISRYAHMVNVDFFKDLMQVLKELINRPPFGTEEEDMELQESHNDIIVRHKLLCIVTAFELLTGQGESLNIDLRDFVVYLYALIPSIALHSNVEKNPESGSKSVKQQSIADIFFHALKLAFPSRTGGSRTPVRSAAFAKRLLTACLSLPTRTTLRCLQFIEGLMVNEPKLQAMLSSEDRTADGLYRPDLDDPEVANPFATSFWELSHLANSHSDLIIREKAKELVMFTGA
ncbi:hypothetical protein M422DRAFT_60254 [Sphaerobolus stellatus SS14]|uniref:Nucleolar complex-associated protein 3 n=1 Tax=Sphaerobolus stellatus (strain SS14) TaxID=990650 RepID=A0A0C9VAZ9_SPHS4|nr:hypothetical protein M422DRAFT_60254 [Sphaerobolus stellatus SS14]